MEAEASSRDLLQRFAGSTTLSDPPPTAPAAAKVTDDGELSLGLSLGGCFGSNPREKTNMLIRSSSISSLLPSLDSSSSSSKDDASFHVASAPLHRTCSLPVPGASDEDHRKRKEMQTLKRLEAKRKRLEKRSSLKDSEKAATWLPPMPQRGSTGSVGSSSSGGGATQGFDMVRFSNISETKSSSNILKMETRGIGVSEMEEEMPCVSTTGNSPNGKRVEGFLYKYRKGEEVRIVCVCHGSFLTPAEFVRHAGLGDVDHPLRHIVVSPPSPFL